MGYTANKDMAKQNAIRRISDGLPLKVGGPVLFTHSLRRAVGKLVLTERAIVVEINPAGVTIDILGKERRRVRCRASSLKAIREEMAGPLAGVTYEG